MSKCVVDENVILFGLDPIYSGEVNNVIIIAENLTVFRFEIYSRAFSRKKYIFSVEKFL